MSLPILCSTLALATAGEVPTVHYELRLRAPDEERVDVEARFEELPPGPLLLTMSPEGSFVQLAEPLLVDGVTARAGERELELERTSPYAFRVADTGGASSLVCRWSVPLTHRRAQEIVAQNDAYEWPYVAEDHALLAMGPLIFQAGANGAPLQATLSVQAPEGWRVSTPWPEQAPGVYLPGPGLAHDLIALGAWESREIPIGDFHASVLVAPGQDGLMDAVGEPIESILRAELELFGRAPRERYLFLFGRADVQGFAGSPKVGSMTLSVGAPDPSRLRGYIAHLVAHEFFHTWASSTTYVPDSLRWWNEGVTDYYAHLVSARVGLTTWDEFASALSDALSEVQASPLWGTTSLEEAGGPRFFEGGEHYRLVYAGGLVLGAWSDLVLRTRHGHTLDEAMRTFLDPERWDATTTPTPDDWLAVLERLGDAELAGTLRMLSTEPFEADFAALFADAGADVRTEETPEGLRLRFDPEPWRKAPAR